MLSIQTNQREHFFKQFPVDHLVDNSVTDFDLYITLEDHMILYSGCGYQWNREELSSLLRSGHPSLYIQKKDEHLAEVYRQIALLPQIEKNLKPMERLTNIEQVGMHFVKCLHGGEITTACAAKGEQIAASIVDCLKEDKNSIKSLSGLGDYDLYTYFHSARVASYTVAMAIQMGLTDHEKLVDIGLGGLMHDVGKKYVDIKIINKSGPLTEEEWAQMKSHPKTGFESVKDSLFRHVPREIILHHHEKANGSGYPDGLDVRSILTEVQLATVADIFDALTSTRSYQNKRTRYEALDFMKHRIVGKEISAEAFKALVGCLV